MPTIFDNIKKSLLPTLRNTLALAYRADFCVGYFNLRGWRLIDEHIETMAGGPMECCRLLVGMTSTPEEELRTALRFRPEDELIDHKTATALRKRLAESFRNQLTLGAPTNADESGLRRLAVQIRAGKLGVKLFLRHRLHAKLYILHRSDQITPIVGYLGSSNLTFSGLSGQGELNVDVVDQDACTKLAEWFEDRWDDRLCVDISQELVEIIDESWASERLTPPYYIYLKMAYHLSREARAGLSEFSIPNEFQHILFDFQVAAVKIAARHLNQRGGVLIGDVVGLGKTLMATALAKIFEDDFGIETLILCPKNLVAMWESYRDEYHLRAKVLSVTRAINELPTLRRYRIVLIDESHNLRNREGKRYRAIQEYIQKNESRCILLSATPYNKSYLDLANQLRLFIAETTDLGIRPERLLREIGEIEFSRLYQAPLRSLEAFEKSRYADDWRELMRLFMVRRTRSFIRDNYAQTDPISGRKFLTLGDGSAAYFPDRLPKTIHFTLNEADPNDQYARLYAEDVVDTINDLNLPRYGLGNYRQKNPKHLPTAAEAKVLDDLSQGGRRLMGFSRTNLFKRLESSGYAFGLSVERHLLRNYIFIHALENNLPLPIGTQGAEMLDTRFEDADAEAVDYATLNLFDTESADGEDGDNDPAPDESLNTRYSIADFQQRAAVAYTHYQTVYARRFKWIRPDLFQKRLHKELVTDAENLLLLLQVCGQWNPSRDAKLDALHHLLTQTYPYQKVLIFSQFADTVQYLTRELQRRGVRKLAGVTGASTEPTALAWQFSPVSNNKRTQVDVADELRILIATDVLSEGQNLQDAHIVINYDLPWAIIRLIQRAGRVDRIGQRSPTIICGAFWPADGVERIIRLRERLRVRLRENAEVVGTDEAFFEDDVNPQPLIDLYHEQAGVLDIEVDTEVDLVSHAYQIWKNATDANPSLRPIIEGLPNVVYAAKAHPPAEPARPPGVLIFINTAEGNSALAWIDQQGNSVTESQFAVLRAAECTLDTPAQPRSEEHHTIVQRGVELMMTDAKFVGGQLGRPSGARFRTYERMQQHVNTLRGTLFEQLPTTQALMRGLEQIYRYPLRESAKEKLNRQLRSGVRDEPLAELVVTLYEEDNLCLVQDDQAELEPRIICSLGLVAG